MVPGISVDNQEPWAMYNIRALVKIDDQGEIIKTDAFLNTIQERFTDTYPGNEPSQSQLEAAQQSAITSYQDVGYVPTGDSKDGKWWVETWNEQQKALPESDRLTLVYGHDSKRGLQMEDYSLGLDSGCVNGEKLTALVLRPNGYDDVDTVVLESHIISVSCPGESEG
jgi:bis(5'-nucleosyl)-tetraphosphatase (symmetrical)